MKTATRIQTVTQSPELPLWKLLVISHIGALLFGLVIGWFMIDHNPAEQYVTEPAHVKSEIVHLKSGT
jgi:plastocyanin domain-containing protein